MLFVRPIRAIALLALTLLGASERASADDWPQWRGQRRDAVSAETGLLRSWPVGGPQVAWQASGLGAGYASVVVARGRVFTIGRHDDDVVVTALHESTGQPDWTRKISTTSRHPMSTPTWDDGRLYALGPDGDLVCLKATSGEVVWQKSFLDDFSGRMMSGRGFGESPLVDGEKLICTPGGQDAALVALDKRTAATLWKTKLPEIGPVGKDGAGFSSVVATQAAGIRQYVQLMGRGVIGIDSRDGRFLWAYNAIANQTANIPTPVVHDEFVFASNGYTAGSVLLKLVPDGNPQDARPGVKAEVVYSLNGSQFQNHHGGVVRLGDFLYGGHGNNNGLPTCLDFKTGRVLWKRRGPGVGSAAVVYADGHLIFRYQNGVVALIEASDRGYNLQGTLEIPGAGGDSWAHPVVANGRLYLREQDKLWVYELRPEAGSTAPAEPPAPVASATLTALEKLGVTVGPLSTGARRGDMATSASTTADVPRPQTAAQQRRPIYDYAIAPAERNQTDPTLLVVLSDKQVTPQGTLSAELLDQLKKLSGALFISLAGTRVSDAGLQQLEELNVVGLNLELAGRVSDAGLEHFERLRQLRVLILTGTNITHAGIRHLTANKNLVALDLEVCDGITDDACEPLGTMRQLKALIFKKTGFEPHRIGDAGLEKLQNLSDLEVLNLYGNNLTDDGLAHLEGLHKLKELHLSLLAISDAGLRHLKPLDSLEHLELLYSEGFAGPLLSDRGVEFLEPLTNLNTLNLTGAKLTDAGLERLRVLKKLKTLQLVRTQVTAEGVQAFQAALPGCEIIR